MKKSFFLASFGMFAKDLDAIDHRHGRVKSANIEDLSPNTIFEELCMEELIKFEAMLM